MRGLRACVIIQRFPLLFQYCVSALLLLRAESSSHLTILHFRIWLSLVLLNKGGLGLVPTPGILCLENS